MKIHTTKDVVFFGRVWFYSWVHFDYVNVREKRRGNEEWTSQRRGLLRAQDTERRVHDVFLIKNAHRQNI
jgi:hypothetical protein